MQLYRIYKSFSVSIVAMSSWVSSGFWIPIAQANIEVTSAVSNTDTGNYSYYYLTSDAATTIIPDTGYRKWNVSTPSTSSSATDEMITFDVRTDKTDFAIPSGGALVVTLKASNGNVSKLVPIGAAGSTGSTPSLCSSSSNVTCTDYSESSTYYFAAIFPMGSAFPIRIGIFPADICAYFNGITGQSMNGCSGASVAQNSTTPITLSVQFSVVSSLTAAPELSPAANALDSRNINLYFSSLASSFSTTATYCTPTLQDYFYRPGDEQLVIDAGAIRTLAGYSAGGSVVPPSKVLAVANVGGLPTVNSQSDLSNSSYLVGRADYGYVGYVTGATNSTSTASTSYGLSLYIVDQAGAVDTSTHCDISTAMATAINGLLTQNECFIATSAFESRLTPEVVILRLFRDTWLKNTAFTRWYYAWSPSAAGWLNQHPWLKPWVRLALLPIVGSAALAVAAAHHPVPFSVFFVVITSGILLGVWRRRKNACLNVVAWFALAWIPIVVPASAGAQLSSTPLLDEVRRQPPAEPETSVIQEVQSAPRPPEESLLEKVKQSESSEPDATGYSAREQERIRLQDASRDRTNDLPESAIAAVASGDSELRIKIDRDIHHAAGIHVGVVRTLNITATHQTNDFATIYPTMWSPDVVVFYEFQPFHSEIFGNFGIVGSLGFSSYRGKGAYTKTDIPKPSGGTYGTVSTVPFQFVAVPATLGINYRFNLLQLLRPFVEASLMLAGVGEFREDGKAAKYGLAKAILLSGGVALLLDWFSSRSAWDLFNESGIKRTYLVARYHVSIPVASQVNLGVNGIYSGLAFEF